jgi:hypothetical protein
MSSFSIQRRSWYRSTPSASAREAEQLVANLAPTPDLIRLALEKHGWHQVRTDPRPGVPYAPEARRRAR